MSHPAWVIVSFLTELLSSTYCSSSSGAGLLSKGGAEAGGAANGIGRLRPVAATTSPNCANDTEVFFMGGGENN